MTKPRFTHIDKHRNLPSPVLTLFEVADLLRCNKSTIYRMVKQGAIPCWKMGSDWRFDRRKIDEWTKGRTMEVR